MNIRKIKRKDIKPENYVIQTRLSYGSVADQNGRQQVDEKPNDMVTSSHHPFGYNVHRKENKRRKKK